MFAGCNGREGWPFSVDGNKRIKLDDSSRSIVIAIDGSSEGCPSASIPVPADGEFHSLGNCGMIDYFAAWPYLDPATVDAVQKATWQNYSCQEYQEWVSPPPPLVGVGLFYFGNQCLVDLDYQEIDLKNLVNILTIAPTISIDMPVIAAGSWEICFSMYQIEAKIGSIDLIAAGAVIFTIGISLFAVGTVIRR